jgi:hypothetical protein
MTCSHCLKTAPLLCPLLDAHKHALLEIVRSWRSLLTNLSQLG